MVRPDLAPMLDLVQDDATQAQAAANRYLQIRSRRKSLRIMVDLQRLAQLGGSNHTRWQSG